MAINVNRVDIRGIVAGALLAILSVYYINSTMFSHTHTIEGATIVHSHFYGEGHTDEDSDCNTHTKGELTLIQHLNNIILLEIETIALDQKEVVCIYSIYVPTIEDEVEEELHAQRAPRAPPQYLA